MAGVQLQAIILADSFTTMFEPITLECPKVLLPLVNSPMIDHTLAWLECADVEQVFVLCSSSHSKQITEHLDKSKRANKPNFSVTRIEAGDALRNVIQSDFLLVSGDTVTNMNLREALEEHKKRKEDNKNAAVMTMVIKQSEEQATGDEIIMGIDPTTKQLLDYEDKRGDVKFEKSYLTVNPCYTLHNDKQDCHIDICSPQVLGLFTDVNVDLQHLHGRDLVKRLFVDDKLTGFKIFTHEMDLSCYIARIDSFRSYKSISKDIIIQRSFVPYVQFSERQVGPSAYIGKDTVIGGKTVISNSVVGDGCKIGSNVVIDGCYIWNNVTIEDGCKVMHAIVCDGVVMKPGAVLEPGVVLSCKVVVGQEHVVRSCSKVSLIPQPLKQDSDKNGDMGKDGSGFIWSMSQVVDHEEEEEWRHRVPAIHKPCEEFFEKEVENIFLKAVHENVGGIKHILCQVNFLRKNLDIAVAKCVGALLYSVMRLALETSKSSGNCLLKETNDVISKWGSLLKGFPRGVDGKIQVILKLEEMCLEEEYATLFVHVLNVLYDNDIIQENVIFKWADEKKYVVEADKVFVEQSEKFIQWLKEKDQEAADLKRLNDGGLQRRLMETDLNEGGVQVKRRRLMMIDLKTFNERRAQSQPVS